MSAMKSKTSKFFAWAIVFLLVVGLAGFGIQDIIAGSGKNNIAIIGSQKVKPNKLVKAIQQEINIISNKLNTNLSFREADQMGASKSALQKLIINAILDEKNKELGIKISDNALIDKIKNDDTFFNNNGKFDTIIYENLLKNANFKKNEYEENIRDELSRKILLSILDNQFIIPKNVSNLIKEYSLEKRKIKLYNLNKNSEKIFISEPSKEILKTIYEENKKNFIKPELKKIELIILKPEDLFTEISINQNDISSYYNKNILEFTTPEKRSIDRVVLKDKQEALNFINNINNKKINFEEVVKEKKLTFSEISLGVVKFEELETKVANEIFETKKIGVIGPIETELGPAIFRIKKIYPKNISTEKEVTKKIKKKLLLDKALRKIKDINNLVSDDIAAGSTYKEIIEKYPFKLIKTDYDTNEKSKAFFNEESFLILLKNANKYPSDTETLSDGSILSLKILEIEKERIKKFIEVKENILEIYFSQEKTKKLLDIANNLKSNYKKNKEVNKTLFEDKSKIIKYDLSRFEENDYINKENNDLIFSLKDTEKLLILKNKEKISLVKIEEIIQDNSNEIFNNQIEDFYSESIKQEIADNILTKFRSDLDIRIYQNNIDETINLFQ